MDDRAELEQIGAVILDIEGTTTPISFVHEVLFPYARERMAAAVEGSWGEAWLVEVASGLVEELASYEGAPRVVASEARSVVAGLLWLMDGDVKSRWLKEIQGRIWRGGYEDGSLKGVVWPDVVVFLEGLARRGIDAYIYSSGSIAAQRLLFGYSDQGDLLGLLKGHFDTTTGGKKEASSYEKIAAQIGHEPARCLFATDHPDEARAAAEAGMQVVVMVRPGNAALPDGHSWRCWTRFPQP
jgi:enolase-phosphatase E1